MLVSNLVELSMAFHFLASGYNAHEIRFTNDARKTLTNEGLCRKERQACILTSATLKWLTVVSRLFARSCKGKCLFKTRWLFNNKIYGLPSFFVTFSKNPLHGKQDFRWYRN